MFGMDWRQGGEVGEYGLTEWNAWEKNGRGKGLFFAFEYVEEWWKDWK